MKKVFKIVPGFLAFLVFIFPQTAVAAKPQPSPTPTSSVLICIDPGHGGSDPGAVYKDITEAQENLIIAEDLESLLVAGRYQVVMTRADNSITLGNSERATICNNAQANYLISIHLNASSNHAIDYTEGLYGKMRKDKTWAEQINRGMSGLLAADGNGTIQNNGITNFADGVLLKANMPATLVETVFISSDAEYNLFINGSRQQQIAQAIFDGITSN